MLPVLPERRPGRAPTILWLTAVSRSSNVFSSSSSDSDYNLEQQQVYADPNDCGATLRDLKIATQHMDLVHSAKQAHNSKKLVEQVAENIHQTRDMELSLLKLVPQAGMVNYGSPVSAVSYAMAAVQPPIPTQISVQQVATPPAVTYSPANPTQISVQQVATAPAVGYSPHIQYMSPRQVTVQQQWGQPPAWGGVMSIANRCSDLAWDGLIKRKNVEAEESMKALKIFRLGVSYGGGPGPNVLEHLYPILDTPIRM